MNRFLFFILISFSFISQSFAQSSNPLHYAVSISDIKYVEALMDSDLALILDFNADGETPVHLAIKNNKENILKLFLSKKYKINSNLKNANNETLIFYAVKKSRFNMLNMILDRGGNPDIKNSKGISAIDLAKSKKYNKTAAKLKRYSDRLKPVAKKKVVKKKVVKKPKPKPAPKKIYLTEKSLNEQQAQFTIKLQSIIDEKLLASENNFMEKIDNLSEGYVLNENNFNNFKNDTTQKLSLLRNNSSKLLSQNQELMLKNKLLSERVDELSNSVSFMKQEAKKNSVLLKKVNESIKKINEFKDQYEKDRVVDEFDVKSPEIVGGLESVFDENLIVEPKVKVLKKENEIGVFDGVVVDKSKDLEVEIKPLESLKGKVETKTKKVKRKVNDDLSREESSTTENNNLLWIMLAVISLLLLLLLCYVLIKRKKASNIPTLDIKDKVKVD